MANGAHIASGTTTVVYDAQRAKLFLSGVYLSVEFQLSNY
jgi:hypothetical protein